MCESLRESARGSVYEMSYYGNIGDYEWVAFYDFFADIGILQNEKFNLFRDFIYSGIYEIAPYERVCIVSTLPLNIHRDENGKMHCLDGYAIEWKDGYGQNHIHGVFIPNDLFIKWQQGTMTATDLLQIDNQEQKRVLLKEYGYEKIFQELGGVVISSRPHPLDKSKTESVVEMHMGDEEDGIAARFVRTWCWSTGREYLLRVDPRIELTKTVQGAFAWIADMDHEHEYHMDVET